MLSVVGDLCFCVGAWGFVSFWVLSFWGVELYIFGFLEFSEFFVFWFLMFCFGVFLGLGVFGVVGFSGFFGVFWVLFFSF